jgi:hypothetical protein
MLLEHPQRYILHNARTPVAVSVPGFAHEPIFSGLAGYQ